MASASDKSRETITKTKNLITVAFAEDAELAEDYRNLLRENDIYVVVKEPDSESASQSFGYAIMVPENKIDDAHVLIESRGPHHDFFDSLFQDDDLGDPDDDFDDLL